MPRARSLTPAVALLFGAAFALPSLAADTNTAGLPSYPSASQGKMDATYRSIPNGQHCIQYASDTPDGLAAVEAWYQKTLRTPRQRTSTSIRCTVRSSSTE